MQASALLLAFAGMLARTALAEDSVITSRLALRDMRLRLNPELRFWKEAKVVVAERDPYGTFLPRFRTEIRSRWTRRNLYLLFVCPYDDLNLKDGPNRSEETFGLWNWDVAEVFLGVDFHDIHRYKEFEVSPQGEWTDLDVDLGQPHHEDGWIWNSGAEFEARIDAKSKVWYGAIRIPWVALQKQRPTQGEELRANFYRSQGPRSQRVQVTWQPTMASTFHVPERFGIMRLTDPGRTPAKTARTHKGRSNSNRVTE